MVNTIASSTSLGGGTHTAFTKNIYGDVQGNLLIDPATLQPVAGSATTTLANPTQNSANLAGVQNNITLAATSGNATVAGNRTAGNATSGDASALANVINIVSSAIGAQNSFLGVVNIYGNLRGDILVPSSFVDSLLGSNSANTSGGGQGSGGTTAVHIANNVNLNAASGNATVSDNYKAGDATSGNAAANLTVFNLTGQQVVAKNSLLVFVNVMGRWVGMIVKAPAGSTAAALGGGVASASTDPTGGAGGNGTVNLTNNISASATSGNATVSDNYQAGDARSGNAAAGANILNLVHSSFNLDDWFGALFINVIGTWLGNFGIAPDQTSQTGSSSGPAAGGGMTAPASGSASIPDSPAASAIRGVQVYQFTADTSLAPDPIPRYGTTDTTLPVQSDVAINPAATTIPSGKVLGSHTITPLLPPSLAGADRASLITMAAGLTLAVAVSIIGVRRARRSA